MTPSIFTKWVDTGKAPPSSPGYPLTKSHQAKRRLAISVKQLPPPINISPRPFSFASTKTPSRRTITDHLPSIIASVETTGPSGSLHEAWTIPIWVGGLTNEEAFFNTADNKSVGEFEFIFLLRQIKKSKLHSCKLIRFISTFLNTGNINKAVLSWLANLHHRNYLKETLQWDLSIPCQQLRLYSIQASFKHLGLPVASPRSENFEVPEEWIPDLFISAPKQRKWEIWR